jgi:predicted transcriptional regulator
MFPKGNTYADSPHSKNKNLFPNMLMENRDKMRDLSVIFQGDPCWCILKALLKRGKASVRDIAAECQIPVPKAVEILREMERRGVVELTVEKSRQYACLKTVSK